MTMTTTLIATFTARAGEGATVARLIAAYADAVRSDQSNDQASRQIQRDIIECDGVAVAQADRSEASDNVRFIRRRHGGHSPGVTASWAGQAALASSFSQATPGRPVQSCR